MNEVEKCIRERRSTPRFKRVPVARELVERVIEAGLWAPSGMNKQSPIIVAVTNRKLRDELAEENRRIMGAPEGMDPFYGAPVVPVVLANAVAPTRVYDGSAAIENMLLAATAMGLGSVWLGSYDGPALRRLYNIPESVVPVGVVYFGYPDQERPPISWYTPEAVYWDRYDPERVRNLRTIDMLKEDP